MSMHNPGQIASMTGQPETRRQYPLELPEIERTTLAQFHRSLTSRLRVVGCHAFARRGWLTSLVLGFLGLCTQGCIQTKMTEPPRAAVEQLLLSTAADRSMAAANLQEVFQDKKVFVDPTYFDSYDKPYVLGTIRDALSSHGALLVADVKDAEMVVEPRNGALSTDSNSTELGIPSIPVPVPLSGVVVTPDLYLFKSQKQFSTAKIALLAYDAKSRKHVYSSGPLVGRAHQNYYSFLFFVKLTRTDIPEKKPDK